MVPLQAIGSFLAVAFGMFLLVGVPQVHADTISFDGLATGVIVTNQFPQVTFSSEAGFVNLTAAAFNLGSSLPNYICSAAVGSSSVDCKHETILTFTNPVNNLSFLQLGDNSIGVQAKVDVFENGVFAATVDILADNQFFIPNLVDLTAFSLVTSIRIHSITDPSGLAWDDFTFTPVSVPEPGTMLLLGTGLLAVGGAARRKRKMKTTST
jgi:hypothetical protein